MAGDYGTSGQKRKIIADMKRYYQENGCLPTAKKINREFDYNYRTVNQLVGKLPTIRRRIEKGMI